VRGVGILDVEQHFRIHVRDGHHLRLLYAPRGHCRRAQPDAAGLEWRGGSNGIVFLLRVMPASSSTIWQKRIAKIQKLHRSAIFPDDAVPPELDFLLRLPATEMLRPRR